MKIEKISAEKKITIENVEKFTYQKRPSLDLDCKKKNKRNKKGKGKERNKEIIKVRISNAPAVAWHKNYLFEQRMHLDFSIIVSINMS